MTNKRYNRRRILLLLLIVACILTIIPVVFIPELPHRHDRMGSPIFARFRTVLFPVKATHNWPSFDTNAPMVEHASLATGDAAASGRIDGDIWTPHHALTVSGLGTGAIATVDLDRLLNARLSPGHSPEARARAIREIKDAIAVIATVRQLTFVFNAAARSDTNAPIILADEGTVDITEPVLQR